MGLITRPKSPSFTGQERRAPGQDPVVASEHFLQEAADQLANEQRFQQTLDAALRETSDEHRRVEKRRAEKASFWLRKMKAGEKLDWDEVVARIRERDPRSAAFLAKLVGHARERGLLED
jgi:hypothetical protein